MDLLRNTLKILFRHLQTITFPLKCSAGSLAAVESETEAGPESWTGEGDQNIFPFTFFLSHFSFHIFPFTKRQELTELLLLPAEATHTQGKAVTLL